MRALEPQEREGMFCRQLQQWTITQSSDLIDRSYWQEGCQTGAILGFTLEHAVGKIVHVVSKRLLDGGGLSRSLVFGCTPHLIIRWLTRLLCAPSGCAAPMRYN